VKAVQVAPKPGVDVVLDAAYAGAVPVAPTLPIQAEKFVGVPQQVPPSTVPVLIVPEAATFASMKFAIITAELETVLLY